jgi:hypothetical protein
MVKFNAMVKLLEKIKSYNKLNYGKVSSKTLPHLCILSNLEHSVFINNLACLASYAKALMLSQK